MKKLLVVLVLLLVFCTVAAAEVNTLPEVTNLTVPHLFRTGNKIPVSFTPLSVDLTDRATYEILLYREYANGDNFLMQNDIIDAKDVTGDTYTTYLNAVDAFGMYSVQVNVSDPDGDLRSETYSDIFYMETDKMLYILTEEHFPDPAFRAFVSDRLDAEEEDEDRDGFVNADTVTWVYLSNLSNCADIRSVAGIELFPNLEVLNVYGTSITTLDISHNPKITDINCGNTKLTALETSNNPELNSLMIFGTDISTLNLSKNRKLTWLEISSSRIQSIDVTAATGLTNMFCISSKNLTSVTLGDHAKLKQLYAEGAPIATLDVSGCPLLLDAIKNGNMNSAGNNNIQYLSDQGDLLVHKNTTLIPTPEVTPTPEPMASPEPAASPEPSSSSEPATSPEASAPPEPAASTEPTVSSEPTAAPEATVPPASAVDDPAPVTVGALKYNISGSTATITGPKSKTAKTLTIPATIKVDGKSYKVTAIKAKAFKGMKKLTKVTIGKNVKTIGKAAFQNCSKLKSIVIKSKLLTAKEVGSSAFKGIAKKVTVKVPASKLSDYKKWLVKKGVPKTGNIKK